MAAAEMSVEMAAAEMAAEMAAVEMAVEEMSAETVVETGTAETVVEMAAGATAVGGRSTRWDQGRVLCLGPSRTTPATLRRSPSRNARIHCPG